MMQMFDKLLTVFVYFYLSDVRYMYDVSIPTVSIYLSPWPFETIYQATKAIPYLDNYIKNRNKFHLVNVMKDPSQTSVLSNTIEKDSYTGEGTPAGTHLICHLNVFFFFA